MYTHFMQRSATQQSALVVHKRTASAPHIYLFGKSINKTYYAATGPFLISIPKIFSYNSSCIRTTLDKSKSRIRACPR